jgi:hypothetical protein
MCVCVCVCVCVLLAGGGSRYGTHHAKGMLLFYHTGVRVVITTANYLRDGAAAVGSACARAERERVTDPV